MKKENLDITLIREKEHRESGQTFQQNPIPTLIKMCDEKLKEVRNSAANKATSHFMRHYGEQLIMKGGHVEYFPNKESIREAHAEEE